MTAISTAPTTISSSQPVSISCEGLTKRYAGKAAVEGVNLEVAPGELLSLLGPSGCGKTTTLRMVAGFETPDAGSIRIGSQDVTRVPAEGRHVGMVFQNYALFPNLSVSGNVGFGLRVAGWNAQKLEARVGELLEIVGLTGFERRNVTTLSGGQRQRVALARALAPNPRVLLLDEPLSALDAKIRAELRTELRRLQLTLGVTTLLVTHDQEEAMSMSDRVVVMNAGHIEQIGSPRDLYATPVTPFVAGFIGAMNVAQLESIGGDQYRIAGQTVKIVGLLENRSGRLGVRPEAINLHHSSQLEMSLEGAGLEGTVELVTYLGADQQVILKLGADTWIARVENDQTFTRGERVQLEIPANAWLRLE
jgi:putative spermidine/putrescine transport system ATP-binding protein